MKAMMINLALGAAIGFGAALFFGLAHRDLHQHGGSFMGVDATVWILVYGTVLGGPGVAYLLTTGRVPDIRTRKDE